MKIIPIVLIAMFGAATSACAAGGGSQQPTFASEQRACANMGLDPGTDAFQSCVSNLDGTIAQANRVDND